MKKIFLISLVSLSFFTLFLSVNIANAELTIPDKKDLSIDICNYVLPENPVYSFEHIYTQVPYSVDPGEMFRTKIFVENTGNVTWFSEKTLCLNQNFTKLGTARDRDRVSVFADPGGLNDSGWITDSRIVLKEEKVEPGQVGTFVFWSTAPYEEDVYREYFQPVIENVTWMENADFAVDYFVGNITYDEKLQEKLKYITRTMRVSEFDIDAARLIDINLSEQKLQAKIGEEIIYEFPISSGKPSTPTPTGDYSVLYKQEVRSTSYIMPNWMAFTTRGHGIHALPSLQYDNGYYWTEALNHIGIPVSHGCVRLLPEDAKTLYEFSPVGTKIHIHY